MLVSAVGPIVLVFCIRQYVHSAAMVIGVYFNVSINLILAPAIHTFTLFYTFIIKQYSKYNVRYSHPWSISQKLQLHNYYVDTVKREQQNQFPTQSEGSIILKCQPIGVWQFRPLSTQALFALKRRDLNPRDTFWSAFNFMYVT